MNIASKTSKILWFVISVLISSLFAITAFREPEKFIPISEFLATIIAILIGVSLAISAVLATPPKINRDSFVTSEDHLRAQEQIDVNYSSMLSGQKVLFWAYYISLILAVCLKVLDTFFEDSYLEHTFGLVTLQLISVLFAFFSSLALLWSATLPSLLHQINIHKMKF